MTTQFDPLIYVAVAFIFFAYLAVGAVLYATKDTGDLETRKIRFAAVLFTGIISLFIFAALLFVGTSPPGSEGQAGQEIFEKAITSMTPLAGAVLGYFFGVRHGRGQPQGGGAEHKDPAKTE